MEALVPRHTHNTHTGVTKEDQASAERNSGGCECKANSNRWNDFSKKAFYVGSFLAEEGGGGLKFCPGSGRNKKTIISSNFEGKLWTCNNQKGEEFFFFKKTSAILYFSFRHKQCVNVSQTGHVIGRRYMSIEWPVWKKAAVLKEQGETRRLA